MPTENETAYKLVDFNAVPIDKAFTGYIGEITQAFSSLKSAALPLSPQIYTVTRDGMMYAGIGIEGNVSISKRAKFVERVFGLSGSVSKQIAKFAPGLAFGGGISFLGTETLMFGEADVSAPTALTNSLRKWENSLSVYDRPEISLSGIFKFNWKESTDSAKPATFVRSLSVEVGAAYKLNQKIGGGSIEIPGGKLVLESVQRIIKDVPDGQGQTTTLVFERRRIKPQVDSAYLDQLGVDFNLTPFSEEFYAYKLDTKEPIKLDRDGSKITYKGYVVSDEVAKTIEQPGESPEITVTAYLDKYGSAKAPEDIIVQKSDGSIMNATRQWTAGSDGSTGEKFFVQGATADGDGAVTVRTLAGTLADVKLELPGNYPGQPDRSLLVTNVGGVLSINGIALDKETQAALSRVINTVVSSTPLSVGTDISGGATAPQIYQTERGWAISETRSGNRVTSTYVDSDGVGGNAPVSRILVQSGAAATVQTLFSTSGNSIDSKVVLNDSPVGLEFSDVASTLGSMFGQSLFKGDRLASSVSGAVFSEIGEALGDTLDGLVTGLDDAVKSAFDALPAEVLQAATGAVSSYLVGALISAVGIDGVAAGILNSAAGVVINQVVQNIANGVAIFANINPAAIGSAIGSYIGTSLASKVVKFDTVGGQIGSQLGSTLSVIAVSALAGGPIGLIPAAVVSFVGYIVGGAIGSIFGGTPRSGADVTWNFETGSFEVTNSWARMNGSKETAESIAKAVATTYNGVLEAIGGVLLAPEAVQAGNYGMRKSDFVYQPVSRRDQSAISRRFEGKTAAEQLINYGVQQGLSDPDFRIAGGDILAKRALYNGLALAGSNFNVQSLLGDIGTAQRYATYLQNSAAINALIAAESDSVFAAEWAITLQRSVELGLTRRAASDWYGGFDFLLDQLGSNPALTGFRFDYDPLSGKISRVIETGDYALADMIDVGGQTVIEAGAGNDTIDLRGETQITTAKGTTETVYTKLKARSGSTNAGVSLVDGVAWDGAETSIDVAATIDAGGGDDVVHLSDRGDNAFGGAGNDTLYGGRLDDWLLGGDGDDQLNAGGAAAAALGGDGNYLDGGAGNDTLIGREGSDWLEGGSGTDTLEGGDGNDVLAGGGGIGDVMRGGRGDDQYIFRLGDVSNATLANADLIRDWSGLTIQSIADQAYGGTAPLSVTNGALFQTGKGLNNWRGGGVQAVDGRTAGGDDALVLGAGIGIDDIKIAKSADGKDLILELWPNGVFTNDRIVMSDWFNAFNKIETIRFADGNEIRLADFDTFILGSEGNDTIIATVGNDFVHAGGGDDVVHLLFGNDFGNGGLGNDTVTGDSGNDIVVGADGNDNVFGGRGSDSVAGGRGNDRVFGDDGNDLVSGGQGDDLVVGGAGDDVFRYSRGDGIDTVIDGYKASDWELVWTSGRGVNTTAGYVLDEATGRITNGAEVLFDGAGKWLVPTSYDIEAGMLWRHKPANANAVVANSGTADSIEFGIGIDINDIQFGTTAGGRDLVIGIEPAGGSALRFTDLKDRIILTEWGPNGQAAARGSIENFIFFNTGVLKTADYTLVAGTDGADVESTAASSAVWKTGGAGDDVLQGSSANDILNGNAGRDRLVGNAGSDVMIGGAGDDVLVGGAGGLRDGQTAGDILVGGTGLDVAAYDGSLAAVTASLATGGTGGDAAGDKYFDVEGLHGSSNNDSLEGDSNDNELAGRAGSDQLRGGAGDDLYLFGRGDGADVIIDSSFSEDEEIVSATGVLKGPYESRVDVDDRAAGNLVGEHVVVNTETGEVVYRKAITGSTYGAWVGGSVTAPPTFDRAAWLFTAGGTGSRVTRSLSAGPAGDDTLSLEDYTGEPGQTGDRSIGLTDINISFVSNDLRITVGSDTATIQAFRSGALAAGGAVERLQFSDGSELLLQNLRFDAAGVLATAGTTGNDLIVGNGVGATSLTGSDGNDTLIGDARANTLNGGAGDDLLVGGSGGSVDTFIGGSGVDTVSYFGSDAGVIVNLKSGAAGAGPGSEALGDTYSEIENLTGSIYSDNLIGDTNANILKGNAGDDWLVGDTGDDVLIGGAGVDRLDAGGGDDSLDGGLGDDLLDGGDGKDTLAGGDGRDHLRGDTQITGFDDVLSGGADSDRVDGGAGNDILLGGDGNDRRSDLVYGGAEGGLFGGAGDDTLDGGAGNDTLEGELGNDKYIFTGDYGQDIVVTGGGLDELIFSEALAGSLWLSRPSGGNDLNIDEIGTGRRVIVSGWYTGGTARRIVTADKTLAASDVAALVSAMAALSPTVPTVWPTTNAAFDTAFAAAWQTNASYADRAVVTGTTGNDPLTADPILVGGVKFLGLAGDDTITGTSGNDVILGGTGNDVLNAGDGADRFEVGAAETGYDQFDGGLGGDTIVGTATGAIIGIRSLAGVERIEAATGVTGVILDLAQGTVLDLTSVDVVGIASIQGANVTAQGETIIGSAAADNIYGRNGNDIIVGGLGDDLISGGGGTDDLDGGAGIDTLDATGITSALTINLATGTSTGDTRAINFENAIGGSAADTIIGTSGANILNGGASTGVDNLQGGDGDDILIGGAGGDTLNGGNGIDTAQFDGAVTIDVATPTNNTGNALSDVFVSIERFVGGDIAGTGDRFTGGAGNDWFMGRAGADLIRGGAGTDTIVYRGKRSDYTIMAWGSTGGWKIFDNRGNVAGLSDGEDTLLDSSVEYLQFSDVTVSLGIDTNNAPMVGTGVADTEWLDGGARSYAIQSTAFYDLDMFRDGTTDQITYSAMLATGLALPSWLTFNPTTRTFSATAPVIGTYAVRVTASDDGASVSDDFILTVREAPGVTINGTANADVMTGTARGEAMNGLAGADTINGSGGADTIDGGTEFDTVTYAAETVAIVVDLSLGTGTGGLAEGDKYIAVENITGGSGNDRLIGNIGANVLIGNAGDDRLEGGDGNDILTGGAGVDTLMGGAGGDRLEAVTLANRSLEDIVDGGQGIDTLSLGASGFGAIVDLTTPAMAAASIEHVFGTAFDDTLIGDSFSNTLNGGLGNDTLRGGEGGDFLDGAGGADIINGDAGDDRIYGGDGNDSIAGDAGTNDVFGDAGDDMLIGGTGVDRLYGGTGTDTAGYGGSNAAITVDLSTGIASGGHAQGDNVQEIENLIASAFDDNITGSDANNYFEGRDGNDVMRGGVGDDILVGGLGADTLFGGVGNDTINGDDGTDTLLGEDGNDALNGGLGNDTITGGLGVDTIDAGDGDDTIVALVVGEDAINGGAGTDTADFGAATAAITADLTLTAHKLTNIENVRAGSGNDILLGSTVANRLEGGSGNDTIDGRSGNDNLIGGDGDDILIGGVGSDQLAGGNGIDTASYTAAAIRTAVTSASVGASALAGMAATTIQLDGVDVTLGGAGIGSDAQGDSLTGIENLTGSANADRLVGDAFNNVIYGGAKNDLIYGGAGADSLYGEAGDDILYGDAGNDLLFGGDGNDRLFGAGESDTLDGGLGNDLLDAGDAGDVLIGGAGDDRLVGGAGDDSYQVTSSSGFDTIYNFDGGPANDSVDYDNSVQYKNLWFTKSGTNLVVRVLGRNSQQTVVNFFANDVVGNYQANTSYAIDFFVAQVRYADFAVNIPDLMAIMAGVGTPPALSTDELPTAIKNQIDAAWGFNGPPTVVAAAGNPSVVAEGQTFSLTFTVDDSVTADAALTLGVATTGPIQQVGGVTLIDANTRKVDFIATGNLNGAASVTVMSNDGTFNSTPLVVPITVDARADDVVITAPVARSGNAGTVVLLGGSLGGKLAQIDDLDGSETFSLVQLTGVPAGVTIRETGNATRIVSTGGTVNITGWDLAKIEAVLPAGSATDLALTLRVQSREASNGHVSGTLTQTINVQVNGAPTGATLGSLLPFDENDGTIRQVGTLSATDPDSGGNFAFAVTGSQVGKFEVRSGNQLWRIGGPMDFEDGNVSVDITVTDNSVAGSPLVSGPFQVSVRPRDLNEQPGAITDSDTATANVISDGATAGAYTGITLASVDPEGGLVSYTITNNPGGVFTVDAVTRRVVVAPTMSVNLETLGGGDGNLSLNIVARDPSNNVSGEYTFALTVADVNEAPVFDDKVSGVNETVSLNGWFDTVAATDPDRLGSAFGASSITYSAIGGRTDLFAVDPVSGYITSLVANFDYDAPKNDRSFQVQLRATDGGGLSDTMWLTVQIVDVDEAPSQPGAFSGSINENTLGNVPGIALSALDPEGQAVRFEFASGGNPGALFAINGTSLQLINQLDFENRDPAFAGGTSVNVSIVAVDGNGRISPVRTGTVTLVNLNDNAPTTPALISDGLSTVSEAAPVQRIATLSTSDVDNLAAPGFQLVGADAGYFEVRTNEIWTRSNVDWEALRRPLQLQVRATDGTNLSAGTWSKQVNITNVDEFATSWTSLPGPQTISENLGVGTVVTTVAASDNDQMGMSYSIVGSSNPNGAFAINPTTGAIRIANGVDYEAAGWLSDAGGRFANLQVQAKDGSGAALDGTIRINISNITRQVVTPTGSLATEYAYRNPNGQWDFGSTEGNIGTMRAIIRDTQLGTIIWEETKTIYFSGGRWQEFSVLEALQNGEGTLAFGFVFTGNGAEIVSNIEGVNYNTLVLEPLLPIVFDLNGDGMVEGRDAAAVSFDVDGTNRLRTTGWISSGDGFLALDRNGNGLIESGLEISFVQDKAGAKTDLEGLAAFDSNGDMRFDASDARFGEFLVWQDVNSNGVSENGELVSLNQRGIVAIDLTPVPTGQTKDNTTGNIVFNTTTFFYADGRTGLVGDVGLRVGVQPAQSSVQTTIAPAVGPPPAAIRAAPAGMEIVADTNGDGVINPVTERIGAAGGLKLTGLAGGADGRIDAGDASYTMLRAWRDLNSNGIADGGELDGLDRVGIAALDVAAFDARVTALSPSSVNTVGPPTTPPNQAPASTATEPPPAAATSPQRRGAPEPVVQPAPGAERADVGPSEAVLARQVLPALQPVTLPLAQSQIDGETGTGGFDAPTSVRRRSALEEAIAILESNAERHDLPVRFGDLGLLDRRTQWRVAPERFTGAAIPLIEQNLLKMLAARAAFESGGMGSGSALTVRTRDPAPAMIAPSQ